MKTAIAQKKGHPQITPIYAEEEASTDGHRLAQMGRTGLGLSNYLLKVGPAARDVAAAGEGSRELRDEWAIVWTRGYSLGFTYYFPRQALMRIRAASRAADIREICYCVFGRGRRIVRVVRVPNRAEDAVCHHRISAADFERVRRRSALRGLKCLGFLHTHPVSEAVPSAGDISGYAVATTIFTYADSYDSLRAFRIIRPSPGYIERTVVLV